MTSDFDIYVCTLVCDVHLPIDASPDGYYNEASNLKDSHMRLTLALSRICFQYLIITSRSSSSSNM